MFIANRRIYWRDKFRGEKTAIANKNIFEG